MHTAVNEDGVLDIASLHALVGFAVWLGFKNGSDVQYNRTLYSVPALPASSNALYLADCNQDSRLDVVILGTDVVWFAANASFGYNSSNPRTIASQLGVATAPSLVAHDFNGDLSVDLVVAVYAGIQYWRGSVGGNFTLAAQQSGTLFSFVLAADVNQDGRMDVIVYERRAVVWSSIRLFLSDAIDLDLSVAVIQLVLSSRILDAAMGDLNMDGYPDLVFASYSIGSNPTLQFFYVASGSTGFAGAPTNVFDRIILGLGAGAVLCLAVNDLDADSAIDVIAYSPDDGMVFPFFNRLATSDSLDVQSLPFFYGISRGASSGNGAFVVADMTNDGFADFIMAPSALTFSNPFVAVTKTLICTSNCTVPNLVPAQCAFGYVSASCTRSNCVALPRLENVLNVTYGNAHGAAATYRCPTGWEPSMPVRNNSFVRRCNSTVWTGWAPRCSPIANWCPTTPPAASVNTALLPLTGTNLTSHAVYATGSGYSFAGLVFTRSLACVTDSTLPTRGVWNGTAPNALAVSAWCSVLSVSSGTTNTSARAFGTAVLVTCQPGYQHTGATSVNVCLGADYPGIWLGGTIVCSAIDPYCLALPNPANGTVLSNPRTVFSISHADCNAGFMRSGFANRTCLASAIYSGMPLTCHLNTTYCPTLNVPANGVRSSPDMFINAQVSFSCNGGFSLVGSSLRTCLAPGSWSGASASCAPIFNFCPPPVSISNATNTLTGRFVFNTTTYSVCE